MIFSEHLWVQLLPAKPLVWNWLALNPQMNSMQQLRPFPKQNILAQVIRISAIITLTVKYKTV